MENVIVLTFRGSDRARASFGALRRLHDVGEIRLQAMAMIERSEDGHPIVVDQAENVQLTATATGGVIAGIIGLLGGPAGMLVGGTTGAVVGSLVRMTEVEGTDGVLRMFASAVPRGHTATIAVLDEPAPEPMDALASEFGVVPSRKSRAELEFELAEAQAATLARRREDEAKRTFGDQLRDDNGAVTDRR
jgi:uncharacterized membrane protein